MNLEKDSAPTGLYNYLPRRSRRTSWQKRTGLKGIGPLKQGLLKKVGYSVTATTTRRHAAVKRAVKKYGRASTIRKLNAVAVYTRRRSPAKSRTFKSDMKFAQKMKGGEGVSPIEQLKYDIEEAEGEAGGDTEAIPQDVAQGLFARAAALGFNGYTDLSLLKSDLKNKLSGR